MVSYRVDDDARQHVRLEFVEPLVCRLPGLEEFGRGTLCECEIDLQASCQAIDALVRTIEKWRQRIPPGTTASPVAHVPGSLIMAIGQAHMPACAHRLD